VSLLRDVTAGMYAFMSLIYAALANLAAVAVLSVHDTAPDGKPHVLLVALLRLLTCSCCQSAGKARVVVVHSSDDVVASPEQTTNDNSGQSDANKSDWSKMAALLDTFFFWLFLSVNFITILVCFAFIPNVNRSDINTISG
jgi:hypothetical protein